MADKVQYESELFFKAAKKTGDARDRINGVLNTLQSSINSRGNPWGNDTLGRSFANGADGSGGYTSSRDNIIMGAQNIAGSLGNFSTGQTKSAKLLEKMERGNRDGFS
ncbi:hypothetical protein [Nocardia sp. CS682]|uniref:hypothetical protein n=1 Tax=Nocardia sp. CS682 TaxID=1047172 RepID=UPI0010757CE6|nr:hypothetical protein [Nocardia sp. CS682]QBS42951.1 hypothetical protein DMB37_25515 [Nocardia sp. CS682]